MLVGDGMGKMEVLHGAGPTREWQGRRLQEEAEQTAPVCVWVCVQTGGRTRKPSGGRRPEGRCRRALRRAKFQQLLRA